MMKPKRKLTARENADKKLRKLAFMTIFINGKQNKIRRPPVLESVPLDEFLRLNADPIWLHLHGEWQDIESE